MGKPHKLPTLQLLLLALIRANEPIALTSAFPYLPEMIESFHVPKNDVAKWAGVVSASLAITQCLVAIPWGRASDRYGRKPAILVSLSCAVLSAFLFGFSKSVTWVVLARSLGGIGVANVGILRTAVAELVPQKELQPRAFSILPLVWAVGSMIAPAMGGALANPARQFPELFGHSTFFHNYPFALPNLVASAFFLVILVIVFLFLGETLASKKHDYDYGIHIGRAITDPCTGRSRARKAQKDHESSALLPESGSRPVKYSAPSYREVFSPQSSLNLLIYTIMVAHVVAFEQLIAVFMHMLPTEHRSSNTLAQSPLKFAGGFGLNSGRIGLIFALYGGIAMFFQFVVYPPVARRYGILFCLKVANVVYPLTYILTPLPILLPSPILQQAAIVAIMIIHDIATVFAFPCITILLTNSARSVRLLGTLNGVATSVTAMGKGLGPAVIGYAFTVGVNAGYIIMPWFLLALLAIGAIYPTWRLVESDGFEDDDEDADQARAGEGGHLIVQGNESEGVVEGSLIGGSKDNNEVGGHGEGDRPTSSSR